MELRVNHRDFIKNKITIQFSPLKIQVLYNGEPVKSKRGKYILKDDNKREREVKIVDYLISSPYVTIDKTEKIEVFSKVPKYMFVFLVPSIIMIRFGVLGWAMAALSIYSIRNVFISDDKTIGAKCFMSVVVIIISYLLMFGLTMGIMLLPH